MTTLNISSFIWGIADDVLRDVYVRGKYRDVILPMDRHFAVSTLCWNQPRKPCSA